ncbi:hypothetical protein BROC_00511 [Candidatus Brocadiaceae bacterium]|nr:hypothetical protein BROC_00511 [Candidatus Brocadiaceae bacterium]
MRTFTIEIEKDKKFYIAQCVEHSNCFTQGKTIEEAIEHILNIKRQKLNITLKDSLVNAL